MWLGRFLGGVFVKATNGQRGGRGFLVLGGGVWFHGLRFEQKRGISNSWFTRARWA